MSIFLFIVLALLMTASLVLIVYGFSAPFAQAALVLLYVLIDGTYAGWKTFFVVLVAAAIAEGIEFFSGVKGAKKAKGSTRSAWGAIIGGIAGAVILSPFIFPVGPILGSFLGTFAGALLLELTSKQESMQALKVGYSATIARIVGFCIKTAISVGIIFGVAGAGIIQMIL